MVFDEEKTCPHCGKILEGVVGFVRKAKQKKCPRCGNNSLFKHDEDWFCEFGLCNYPNKSPLEDD